MYCLSYGPAALQPTLSRVGPSTDKAYTVKSIIFWVNISIATGIFRFFPPLLKKGLVDFEEFVEVFLG